VQWQQPYESCVFERNLEKLNKLVFETEDAIYLRSRELSNESHIAERSSGVKTGGRGIAGNQD
jgi:hypothetical protein